MDADRQILFLQGLPGSFFFRLGRTLAAQGYGVHRINFNGGDQLDWPAPGAVNYRGSLRNWPSFVARMIRDRAITDVVLFGDCRPMHRTARATAAGLGVAVHVFEEGYLRPDWVTLERGGVNGFSPLPSDPQWYRKLAASLPPVGKAPLLPSSLKRRMRETVRYYISFALLAWGFPRYRTHRPWSPAVEAAGWMMKFTRRAKERQLTNLALAHLIPRRYFLLPLQLDSDYQLRAHSDFDGMQPALAGVLASFAAHAPKNVQLAVKAHPLDNGLINWRKQTTDCAAALGIADRVLFLDSTDIAMLVANARGVVTVNSTTGTLALEAGVPVFVLGRAIYAIPGLTHQEAIETFWCHPAPPDAPFYEAFKRVLVERCLVRGGFYTDDSLAPLTAESARRIVAIKPTHLGNRRAHVAQTPGKPIVAEAR